MFFSGSGSMSGLLFFVMIPGIIVLGFIVFGIILLIKSKKLESKSLKYSIISILIPAIAVIPITAIRLISTGGGELAHTNNLSEYLLTLTLSSSVDSALFIWIGIPFGIISIILSIISISKLEERKIPITILIYGIVYFILSIISLLLYLSQ